MYEVLKTFKEKDHNGHVYKEGDIYPIDGQEASLKRVSYLQEINPVYGVRFLGPVEGVPLLPQNNSDEKQDGQEQTKEEAEKKPPKKNTSNKKNGDA